MDTKVTRSCLIVALAFAQASHAQSTFDLGRIEVNATRELPAMGTATVDAAMLREENRETVTEALDRLPGITANNVGNRSEGMVFLRGFDLRQVPVLVDGIPVYVPYDGYVDLNRFTTFDLSEVSANKGYSSVLLGPNALGGAINLVSRRPSEKLEGEIGVGYNTGDDSGTEGKRTWLNLGSNQGLWYAQLGASYLQQDSFSLSDDFDTVPDQGSGARENAERKDTKVNIKLGLTPNATDEYAIGYIKQDGEKYTPPYAGSHPDVRIRYWRWPYWDKESIYFLSNTALGDDSYIKTRLYHDTFDNLLRSFDDDSYTTQTRGYAFNSVYDDRTYGASVEFGKTLGRHALKLAAHYKLDEHKEHDVGDPKSTFRDRTTSYAIEDTITLTDRTYLVGGVSYDKRRTLKAEKYDSDAGYELFDHTDSDAWNPQIGLFTQPNERNQVRLTLSQKSRFPTIKDRYSYRMGGALPNPDLKQEKATTVEAGWVHMLTDAGRLEAAVFYSDIRDLIQQVSLSSAVIAQYPGLDSDAVQYQNVGKVESSGVELSGDFWVGDFEFGAHYSYLHRKNKSSDLKLTDVPRQKLFAYVSWHLTQPLSLSFSSQYESKRYTTTDGERIARPFTVTDMRATYAMPQGFTARLGVSNLFDKDYAYQEGYPEAGRTYYANLSYQF